MQYLHADASIGIRDRIGHLAVARELTSRAQFSGKRRHAADDIRSDATGHNQAHSATCPLGEILGQNAVIFCPVFQAGMHGAHEHPVF